jgi:hypothetical protein
MEVKMSRTGSFVMSLVGVLLLIGLMAGGGFMAYRAGVAQGIAQAPQVAEAISRAAENGQQVAPVAPMYGYGYGYPYAWGYRPHFGFFPFGFFGAILFIFFFFGLLRFLFFRPWRMGWGYYGHHHGHPWGGPPWMRPEGEEGEKRQEKPEDKM